MPTTSKPQRNLSSPTKTIEIPKPPPLAVSTSFQQTNQISPPESPPVTRQKTANSDLLSTLFQDTNKENIFQLLKTSNRSVPEVIQCGDKSIVANGNRKAIEKDMQEKVETPYFDQAIKVIEDFQKDTKPLTFKEYMALKKASNLDWKHHTLIDTVKGIINHKISRAELQEQCDQKQDFVTDTYEIIKNNTFQWENKPINLEILEHAVIVNILDAMNLMAITNDYSLSDDNNKIKEKLKVNETEFKKMVVFEAFSHMPSNQFITPTRNLRDPHQGEDFLYVQTDSTLKDWFTTQKELEKKIRSSKSKQIDLSEQESSATPKSDSNESDSNEKIADENQLQNEVSKDKNKTFVHHAKKIIYEKRKKYARQSLNKWAILIEKDLSILSENLTEEFLNTMHKIELDKKENFYEYLKEELLRKDDYVLCAEYICSTQLDELKKEETTYFDDKDNAKKQALIASIKDNPQKHHFFGSKIDEKKFFEALKEEYEEIKSIADLAKTIAIKLRKQHNRKSLNKWKQEYFKNNQFMFDDLTKKLPDMMKQIELARQDDFCEYLKKELRKDDYVLYAEYICSTKLDELNNNETSYFDDNDNVKKQALINLIKSHHFFRRSIDEDGSQIDEKKIFEALKKAYNKTPVEIIKNKTNKKINLDNIDTIIKKAKATAKISYCCSSIQLKLRSQRTKIIETTEAYKRIKATFDTMCQNIENGNHQYTPEEIQSKLKEYNETTKKLETQVKDLYKYLQNSLTRISQKLRDYRRNNYLANPNSSTDYFTLYEKLPY